MAEEKKTTEAPAAKAVIEKWFQSEFHGTIFAQNTDLYNMLRKAVDKLPDLLK